jgi:predicted ester cyclase
VDAFVAVMRRYAEDYLSGHDTAVCAEIMEPDYVLRIGDHVMSGRDDVYVPAVVGQFEQFPDLRLTVHQIMTNGDRLALQFSEQGSSNRHEGRKASWAGVGLYAWNGRRLTENFAEEDYFGRRRQLAEGVEDGLEQVAASLWDETPAPPTAEAEDVVRRWLADPAADENAVYNDAWTGQPSPPLVEVTSVAVHDIFSAGNRVAFHALQQGTYGGGFPGLDAAIGAPARLHSAGIVRVEGGSVVSGRVVSDRLGLMRSLERGR